MSDKAHALWSSYKHSQAEQAVGIQQIPHQPTPAQVLRLLSYATAAEQALQKLVDETPKSD